VVNIHVHIVSRVRIPFYPQHDGYSLGGILQKRWISRRCKHYCKHLRFHAHRVLQPKGTIVEQLMLLTPKIKDWNSVIDTATKTVRYEYDLRPYNKTRPGTASLAAPTLSRSS
jgi:hypothetical protein